MTRVRLGDVAREVRKRTLESSDLPTVGLEHLDSGEVELTRWNEGVETTFTKEFEKGQVLFGRRRAYLHKAVVAPFDGVCSGDITVIAAGDGLSPRLLPFIIQNDALFKHAVEKSAGSLSPRVKWQGLAEFEIELPGIQAQEGLADVLWAAQETKRRYKLLLATCDDVVKSQFVEMFGDPIDNTFHKPIASFSDLGKWQSGGTPARSNTSYFEGGIDWYSAGELNGFHLRSSIEKITIEALNQSAAKLYPAGSLLVGMYDTAALKMGVLDKAAASNQACACLIPNDSVLVEWLYTAISIMKPHLLSQRKGCRQKNLSLKMIKGFNLPIADKAEQRDFAVFFHSVDKSKFAVQQALDELNATTKKILNQELGLGDV